MLCNWIIHVISFLVLLILAILLKTAFAKHCSSFVAVGNYGIGHGSLDRCTVVFTVGDLVLIYSLVNKCWNWDEFKKKRIIQAYNVFCFEVVLFLFYILICYLKAGIFVEKFILQKETVYKKLAFWQLAFTFASGVLRLLYGSAVPRLFMGRWVEISYDLPQSQFAIGAFHYVTIEKAGKNTLM